MTSCPSLSRKMDFRCWSEPHLVRFCLTSLPHHFPWCPSFDHRSSLNTYHTSGSPGIEVMSASDERMTRAVCGQVAKMAISEGGAGKPASVQSGAGCWSMFFNRPLTHPRASMRREAHILLVRQPPLRRRAKKPTCRTICNKGLTDPHLYYIGDN